MKLLDSCKFVVGTFPATAANTTWNNQTYLLGNAVNMENYGHLTVVLIGGPDPGPMGLTTLINAATDAACVIAGIAAGTSWYVDPSYYYVNTCTSAESDTWTKTAVATAGSTIITAPFTVANENYIIELDAAALTHGPWVAVNSVQGTAGIFAALYILSQPRYISAETAPTAIV